MRASLAISALVAVPLLSALLAAVWSQRGAMCATGGLLGVMLALMVLLLPDTGRGMT